MKNFKFFILGFLFLISSNRLSSQLIESVTSNYYNYMNESYEYVNMDSIFAKSTNANAYFLRAKKQFKTSKSLGIFSLSSLGVGVTGLLVMGSSDGLFSDDPAFGIGAAMLGLGALFGAIMGTSGLISRASGKKNQLRSVTTFNQEQSKLKPEERKVELNVVAKNGIGIQLKF